MDQALGVSMINEFRKKRFELSNLVEKWWQQEQDFVDFEREIKELKILARKCPYIYFEEFDREILEIEVALRDDFLIE